jgi:hypothetical protein
MYTEAPKNNTDLCEAPPSKRGEEPPTGTSTEEDLLGTFSCTRKPYLNGSGSSAWGVTSSVSTRK